MTCCCVQSKTWMMALKRNNFHRGWLPRRRKNQLAFTFFKRSYSKRHRRRLKFYAKLFHFSLILTIDSEKMVYAKPARLRFSICQTEPKKLQILGRQCNAMQWISVVWHQQPKEWNCINNGGRRRRWGGLLLLWREAGGSLGGLSRPAL